MDEEFEGNRSQNYGQPPGGQQQPSGQQEPQPPTAQQQKEWDQQPGPRGYHPGKPPKKGLGKTPIMVLLMVSMLLIAVAGVWTVFSGVPNYDIVEDLDRDDYETEEDYEDAREQQEEDREDFQEGQLRAHKYAGMLAFIGLILGGIISLYAGLGETELSDKEKTAMLVVAGLFIIGMMLLFNHYPWFNIFI
ncbi:MAG: hypothetical protein R6W73_00030 [Candidatus Saliniplasma sp.]